MNLTVEERIVLIDELNHEQTKNLVHDILKEDINSGAKISEIENDFSALEDEVRDLENEVIDLEKSLEEKDEKITELESKLEALQGIEAFEAIVLKKVAQLEAQLATAQQQISVLNSHLDYSAKPF
jgi:peptidoglycan hydrolase CwlO-like protein